MLNNSCNLLNTASRKQWLYGYIDTIKVIKSDHLKSGAICIDVCVQNGELTHMVMGADGGAKTWSRQAGELMVLVQVRRSENQENWWANAKSQPN